MSSARGGADEQLVWGPDGDQFNVPRGVTVMIDAVALLQLRDTNSGRQ